MLVPFGVEHSLCSLEPKAPTVTCEPTSSCSRRVLRVISATAAMEARASPLKPKVRMRFRSSGLDILDVACLSKHSRASSGLIPHPLSMTLTSVLPASPMMTLMELAPASTAFSISSFTTEEGRPTTSPAAIILASWAGNTCSFPIRL